jgi:hypothetical protein
MTTMNGTATIIPPALSVIEVHDARADLDAWDDAITDLDAALTTAADARLTLERQQRHLEAIEASVVLSIDGKNAEERKARLVLALNDDARHLATVRKIDEQRARLLDAERRTTVAKERCRLLRSGLALVSSAVD